ncbi:hypothetical protein [Rugamonas rubra]|uniref:Uncharacterized protein n=1 Tax=Rugamonas rubra TaxID=758825 RepID=A0A1I4M3U9_9BURK|nr:hypothetical protein [Rugamonas rubra]SFL97773.1 hypothetical protein SAMN02982985_02218 [Rugamonas rubra]
MKLNDSRAAAPPTPAPTPAPAAGAARASVAGAGRGGAPGAAGDAKAPPEAGPAPAPALKKRAAAPRGAAIAWPAPRDCAIGAEARQLPAVLLGLDDRAAHLALAGTPGRPQLRAPAPGPRQAGSRARPRSRGECEQRCGGVGRCDASLADSCGGALCGRDEDAESV